MPGPVVNTGRKHLGSLTQLRRMYQTVVLPAILYGSSARYTFKTDGSHQQTRLRILNRIQSRASRIITGAFRATAVAALDIEAYILPIKQLLEKRSMQSYLQVRTSRAMDLIQKAREGEAMGRSHIRSGWRPWDESPLQKIEDLVHQHLEVNNQGDIEIVHPFIVPPYWVPPEITVERNAEKAIERHRTVVSHSPSLIAIYTDGSAIRGRVGASVVCPQLHEVRSVYMDEDSGATVYAAELQGILLALIIAIHHRIRQVAIFVDN